MAAWIASVFALIPFYLLGSFPSGIILARLYGIDITQQGSGNVGATNVARTIGKRAGVLTLLLDLSKGWLGVTLAGVLTTADWYAVGAAIAVVSGHCFSLPPILKGGKGVATGLGILLGLVPGAAITSLVVFSIVFGCSRLVSLASLLATLSAPIYCLVTAKPDHLSFGLVLVSLVIIFRHYENIVRLIEGREPKFALGSKADPSLKLRG